MIINGASRSNGAFFSRHLMRADENERVTVQEMRGFAYAEDVPSAFQEMRDFAGGTRCKNYFYHANINTRADEHLTPEQWAQAVDTLEGALQLDGQPRLIVEHEKEGRVHQHVIWSRIDPDSMTAISDSHNYRTHELVATQLEETFGHATTERALTRDKEATPRPEPNVKDWESFRAAESKMDPKVMKAELTELWQQSDSGPAFAAALDERGYILARGDRRDFCVIDAAGDEHSLGRRISGVKAAEIRARMADIDPETLPSVEEGRELARQRQEAPTGDSTAETPQAEPVGTFDAVMAETAHEASPPPAPAVQAGPLPSAPPAEKDPYRAIMAEAVQEARADHAQVMAEDSSGGRFARFRSWWSGMRDYAADFNQHVQDYWQSRFGRDEPEHDDQATPGNTVTAAQLEPQQTQDQSRGMEQSL